MQLDRKPPNYKDEIIKNLGLGRGEIWHVPYKAGCTGYHRRAINQAVRVQRTVTLPGEITEDRQEGSKSLRQRERHKQAESDTSRASLLFLQLPSGACSFYGL